VVCTTTVVRPPNPAQIPADTQGRNENGTTKSSTRQSAKSLCPSRWPRKSLHGHRYNEQLRFTVTQTCQQQPPFYNFVHIAAATQYVHATLSETPNSDSTSSSFRNSAGSLARADNGALAGSYLVSQPEFHPTLVSATPVRGGHRQMGSAPPQVRHVSRRL